MHCTDCSLPNIFQINPLQNYLLQTISKTCKFGNVTISGQLYSGLSPKQFCEQKFLTLRVAASTNCPPTEPSCTRYGTRRIAGAVRIAHSFHVAPPKLRTQFSTLRLSHLSFGTGQNCGKRCPSSFHHVRPFTSFVQAFIFFYDVKRAAARHSRRLNNKRTVAASHLKLGPILDLKIATSHKTKIGNYSLFQVCLAPNQHLSALWGKRHICQRKCSSVQQCRGPLLPLLATVSQAVITMTSVTMRNLEVLAKSYQKQYRKNQWFELNHKGRFKNFAVFGNFQYEW